MEIKVLGPGCPRCQQTLQLVKDVLKENSVQADLEKVADAMEIAKYGVFTTPGVVVDGQVKSVGRVPSREELQSWIQSG